VTGHLRMAIPISMALVAAAAAGCGRSTTSRFYTLTSTATAEGTPAASYSVSVGPVSVPGEVDRPQLVVQVEQNRVEVQEFDRWAGPLGEGIARAVAGDLGVLLGTPQVMAAPPPGFTPTYRVAIDVLRFESVPGKSVQLDAAWVVRSSAAGDSRMGRTVADEAVAGEGYEALAAAHSRALGKMSADIAAAIRSEAEKKP
jgi:uncharacterized lipoprotein YmbA